jgi:hypothetical protein
VSHSDPIIKETTQGIDPDLNDFSPDIAERAKMRTRKATKRSSPYAEEVIDITDDEIAVTPTRMPKERVKPRPIKRTTPVGNNLQLNSDPVAVPIPSSSSLLPPSDPFPESTVINSTPPRPHPPVEAATPDSPSQESPIQPRKRKRTVRLHSPTDNVPDPNSPPAVPARVTSPRSDSQPPPEGVVDVVDLGQNLNSNTKSSEDGYDMTKTPKKLKSSKSAEKGSDRAAARPESSGLGKSRKKTIVEVVIMSPRKRKTKKKVKTKKKDSRNPERNDTEPENDHLDSSPNPAKRTHKTVEDEDVFTSRQRSDSDDELILAPKRESSSKVKARKGKQKACEPSSADNDARSGTNLSSGRVAAGEKEKEDCAEGVHTRTDEDHKSQSYPAEPKSSAPLLVSLMSISRISIADPTQERPKHNASAQDDDPPKRSPTRETPAPGRSRYSLSRSDRKTPMQELIRRAASHPNALFSVPSSPIASPLAKTSKSALRRIAPLHPARRTPPPPPPRPPPPKKSKKMLDLEEKWEMELEDEVEGWWALTDEERQDWRRAKRDKELGFDD